MTTASSIDYDGDQLVSNALKWGAMVYVVRSVFVQDHMR